MRCASIVINTVYWIESSSCNCCCIGGILAAFSRTGTGRNVNVEDLKHFLLECPVYDDLRAACPAFPADVYSMLSHPGCVASVMGHDAQAALASTLYRMKVRRAEFLGLPVGMI